MQRRKVMGELIVPIVMIFIALAFHSAAGNLNLIEGFPMTSATYPQALSVMMLLCSAFLIIRFCVKRRKYIAEEKNRILDPRIFLAFLLLIALYVGIDWIGYITSGIIFLVLLTLILKEGKPRLLDTVILPVCLPVALYYIFQFMGIYLPNGRLFRRIF
jgi:hypothetical protein